MITTFNGTTQYNIYHQALMLSNFDVIKDTFLSQLDNNTSYTDNEKNAIKLAAEKLRNYPSSDHVINDGALLGIMNIDWQTTGATGVDALTIEQRSNILEGVLAVCKSIILQESDRMATVASGNTHLSYGYGYGSDGYGYGFNNIDFFQVF